MTISQAIGLILTVVQGVVVLVAIINSEPGTGDRIAELERLVQVLQDELKRLSGQ